MSIYVEEANQVRLLLVWGWVYEKGLWYHPDKKEPTTQNPMMFTFEQAVKIEGL